jgi:ferredoxin
MVVATSIEEQVKTKAMELGADFVGIASRSRFEAAPEWTDPRNLLSNFQSVISFGIATNRGSLESWFNKKNRRPEILGRRWGSVQVMQIALHLSHWLERQGFKSTFATDSGYTNVYRDYRPDFSQKHAAVAAGLGKPGRSSLVVHPEFGAAVQFGSVITEAELEPDSMMGDDFNPCADCEICINICPTKAIARKKTVSFVIEGREYTHNFVNKPICIWGCGGFTGHHYQMNGRTVGTWSYNDMPVPIKEIKEAEERTGSGIEGILYGVVNMGTTRHPMELAEMELSPSLWRFDGTEFCGYCQKVCLGTPEERQALLELHLNSGVVQIPEDKTLLNYLKIHNSKLRPWPIPGE